MTFAIWGTESDVATGSGVEKEMVAALPNGGYVVVWRDNNILKFQIYNGLGAKVGTAKALPSTGGSQYIADIQAVGNEGNFAISWNDGQNSIRTRVFDVDGTDVSGPNPIILKSGLSLGNLDSPAMATWGSTRFVTAYTEGNKIQLALQDSKGVLQRTIEVATANTLDQVDVTEIAVGRFVVRYAEGQDTIFFKIVDVIANTLTEAFEVGAGDDADVVALKAANGSETGAFAVTTQNAETVQTTFYSTTGTKGNTVTVALKGLDEYDYVHTTALKGGRVAVVYSQWVGSNRQSPDDNGDIFLTIVNADGTHVTYTAPLNARSASDKYGQQYTPTISEMADGRVVVAWDDPSYDAITSVIFDPRLVGVNVNGTAKNDIYVGTTSGAGAAAFADGDQLYGYAGDDLLRGEGGNDTLFGGIGADTLDGGNGTGDWADYSQAASTGGTKGLVISLRLTANNAPMDVNTGEAAGDRYSGVENLRGSAHDDILIGNEVSNILEGGNGYNRLYGGAGTVGDHHKGGAGWDVATYEYSTAGVGIVLDLGAQANNRGEASNDTFEGIESFFGSNYNDTMAGAGTLDVFYGHNGNDLLQGKGDADQLYGGEGDDTLEGGVGGDKLDGGNGDGGIDFVSYENAETGIEASLWWGNTTRTGEAVGDTYIGIEGLIGSARGDIFQGNSTNDELRGMGGDDHLRGEGGSDTLEGGLGKDTLDGGATNGSFVYDLASYAHAGGAVTVNLLTGVKTGEAAEDTYISIAGVIGSAYADTLTGDGNANTLRGGAQNDTLIGAAGADRLEGEAGNDALIGGTGADTLQGGIGDDNLDGGDDADRLEGGDGRDVLKGGTGADALDGGAGDDNLDGGADSDRLDGGLGNDVLTGGAGADTLAGGVGDDTYHVDGSDTIVEGAGQGTDTVYVTSTFTLSQGAFIENIVLSATAAVNMTGNELDNVLTGNAAGNALDGQAGNDTIVGGAGADAMTGGVGNDLIYVDDAGDGVVEQAGQGSDTVMVNTAVYALSAGAEVETLVAGSGAVRLTASNFANAVTGNALSNQLWGLAGNDRIAAGSGNDKIYGGLGNDTLYGEGGRDIFVFDTKTNKSTNVDRVEDFRSRDDSIYLENRIFTKLGSGTASKPKKFNADMFVQGKKALDREDRIIYDKKTGALYYDQDGTGSKAQVKIATITNKAKLSYHDFFVI